MKASAAVLPLLLLALAPCARVAAQSTVAPAARHPVNPAAGDTQQDWNLIEAVENRSLPSALTALRDGAHVNARDAEGDTPIMQAAIRRNMPLFRLLMAHGASIRAKNILGMTPLAYAAAGGSAAIVSQLIAHGADLKDDGPQAMVSAAGVDHPEIIRLLMRHGISVNARTKSGETPLIMAIGMNMDFSAARFLLAHGANVNARDNGGSTPLMSIFNQFAAGRDTWTPMLRILIQRGANVRARSDDGSTALMCAVISSAAGQIPAMRLLIKAGVPVNAATDDGTTALMIAAQNGQTSAAGLLLQQGAAVNAHNQHGDTVLMRAVIGASRFRAPDVSLADYANAIALLLAHGADPSLKNSLGQTSLDVARQGGGQREIMQILDKYELRH